MKQVSARVADNTEITPGVYLAWLDTPAIVSTAQPGQFVMVRCGEELLLRRPLSIHQVDDKREQIALLYSVVGKGTEWLAKCKAGDSLDVLGPMGNGFSVNPASQNLLLVAGGMGIAPIYYLAEEAFRRKRSVKLLYGTASVIRYPRNLLPPNVELFSTTEDGSIGDKGLVIDGLSSYLGQAEQVFACGPLPMYKTMAQMPEIKNKPIQVSLEVVMGCGLGICYGCTVKTRQGLKQVCRDGPVFNLDDIVWGELNW